MRRGRRRCRRPRKGGAGLGGRATRLRALGPDGRGWSRPGAWRRVGAYFRTMKTSKFVRLPRWSLTIRIEWPPLPAHVFEAMIRPIWVFWVARLNRPRSLPSTNTLTKPEACDRGATYSTDRPLKLSETRLRTTVVWAKPLPEAAENRTWCQVPA